MQVRPRGIIKTLSNGYDEALARSVPFVPQIIETGIYLAKGKTGDGMKTHSLANKLLLDGKDYVVGFVQREDQNGQRLYDHELTEIINPDSLNAASLSKDGEEHATRANRGDVMKILRDRSGVNDGTGLILFQADGAAVFPVREGMTHRPDSAANGQPAHGTDAIFEVSPGVLHGSVNLQGLKGEVCIRTPPFMRKSDYRMM